MHKLTILIIIGLLILTACVREQPRIIIITATFLPATDVSSASTPVPQQQQSVAGTVPELALSPVSSVPLSVPTPDPARNIADIPSEHTVQSGETLFVIAQRYNLSLETIVQANSLANPDILEVGQVLILPGVSNDVTPMFKIVPDSRFVRAPGSNSFNIAAFVGQMPGYIRIVSDQVTTGLENGSSITETLSGAQIVERVALEYSIDPRLLLAFVEYRAGWLTNPHPSNDLIVRPLASFTIAPNSTGFYNQLAWLANQLNRGYYGWKYGNIISVQFGDTTSILYNGGLNAGTVAVQYGLSLDNAYSTWLNDVQVTGFYRTYTQFFGDPFANPVEPLIPPNLLQPQFMLPFEPGVEWRYTGGPHGGWGAGSAWASVDFAPSEDRPDGVFCYVSSAWVTAVAPGVIARSDDGAVILDLDNDGDESTGWTVLYLHMASQDRISAGTQVFAGQRLGHPSCEGGYSNATHLHIARRFNGEWLPADCTDCPPDINIPSFAMSGWDIVGLSGQEYQGYMQRAGTQIIAEQGREATINRIVGE